MKNRLLLVVGWFFVGLGFIGVVLPLVPTSPFLLVALFCFSRSSPRFYQWLYHHRVFGEPLREWCEHRRVSKRALAVAGTMMTISVLTTVLIWQY